MNENDFWSSVVTEASAGKRPRRLAALRPVLLFAGAAAALAVVVLGVGHHRHHMPGYDQSFHRMMLESMAGRSMDGICVMDADGRETGDC